MATLLPNGEQTFFDADGNPLSLGSVYFYIPSTTTNKNTWQDSGQTILNTNPVVLDIAGRAIIYGSGTYRQVVKDALGNTVWDQITADTSSGSNSWSGTSGGTANAQTVTATNFTSTDGQSIDLIFGFTNTNALTLNPNGTGPINVLKDTTTGSISLTGGEAVAGNLGRLVYSSATGAFHLTSYPVETRQTFTNIASATSTDLGTLATKSAQITGTTTITSFGSSANTTNPFYNLRFSGILTLTYNATSMILPGAADITTAANDTALAIYLGSGNWQVVNYSRAAARAEQAATGKRQTVTSGPSDASGYPNFLPATAGALSVTSQNISSTAPLIVTSANGFASFNSSVPSGIAFFSQRDLIGQSTANLTWGSLTNTATNYLFVTVSAAGGLTAGSTIVAPIYQYGGTVSVTNGQYTYVINDGKMYLGNGATAPQVSVVFVGEAVASGGTVTSTVAYAYNGIYQYDDGSAFPAAGVVTTKNHNIGSTVGLTSRVSVTCSTAELGYAVGDIIDAHTFHSYYAPITPNVTRNTVKFVTGSANSLVSINNSTGAYADLTEANWRYRLKAWRIW